jgi:cell wall-associated NlpC family hydrolase
MNKRFAAIGIALTLVLTTCSSIVIADEGHPKMERTASYQAASGCCASLIDFMKIKQERLTLLEYQVKAHEYRERQKRLKNKELEQNLADLTFAINNTKQHVDKTWYVFSGSTPRGWDCSGLVKWTYSHLGIDLWHGASAQMEYGEMVEAPKYGDLVGFSYDGSNRFHHVGIYLSDDTMLHAGGKNGDRTEIRSISNFAGKVSKVSYSRILNTK